MARGTGAGPTRAATPRDVASSTHPSAHGAGLSLYMDDRLAPLVAGGRAGLGALQRAARDALAEVRHGQRKTECTETVAAT